MTRPLAATAFFLLAIVAAAPAACSGTGRQKRDAGVYIVTVRPPAAGVNVGWYQMHILAAALGG
jgi:hypothetical protein